MGKRSTWLWLIIGCAALLSPWRIRYQLAGEDRPLALIFVGPSNLDFIDSGLASELSQAPLRWNVADLALIRGAAEDAIWRRLETGVIYPNKDLPSLLSSYGIAVHGLWSTLAISSFDEEVLAASESAPGASVGVLDCARGPLGLRDERCRACFRRAADLVQERARAGDTAFLITVPPGGWPDAGTIWVAGPHLKEAPRFRFREIDLTPTLLYLTGNPIPVIVAGVPGLDLFDGEYMFHHPIRYLGGGN